MSLHAIELFFTDVGPYAGLFSILAWVIIRQQRMNEALQDLVERCEKWRKEDT